MIDDNTRKAFNQATYYIRRIELNTRNKTFGEWGDAMDKVFVEADRIVRCKDCKFYDTYDCFWRIESGSNMEPDWFCADGKKRDR